MLRFWKYGLYAFLVFLLVLGEKGHGRREDFKLLLRNQTLTDTFLFLPLIRTVLVVV
jgi:hypothetical protein